MFRFWRPALLIASLTTLLAISPAANAAGGCDICQAPNGLQVIYNTSTARLSATYTDPGFPGDVDSACSLQLQRRVGHPSIWAEVGMPTWQQFGNPRNGCGLSFRISLIRLSNLIQSSGTLRIEATHESGHGLRTITRTFISERMIQDPTRYFQISF